MRLRDGASAVLGRLRHPQTTVRWRLTLLYGGLFLICGAALLAITYTLVAHATVGGPGSNAQKFARVPPHQTARGVSVPMVLGARPIPPQITWAKLPPVLRKQLRTPVGKGTIVAVGAGERITDLHQLVIESGIALAIMAIISGGLGWMVAGRVLRPVRMMTAATQEISEASLDRRLAIAGPPDELKRLADTIDGLLSRLEGAFDAQRRFVANASHELRTPLTAARAMLEMVISDPNATVETFRDTCGQVLEEGEHEEQLIDALLALAQGQRGIEYRELIDLAALGGDVLEAQELEIAARGLDLDVSLEPALVSGDRRLIERLVSNLVQNAVRHNVQDGNIGVHVGAEKRRAVLRVINSGPVVPEVELERLLQPFQRLIPDRVEPRQGLGLGLSIVAAIADAHNAALTVSPHEHGGLEVTVRFPPTAQEVGRPARALPPVSAQMG